MVWNRIVIDRVDNIPPFRRLAQILGQGGLGLRSVLTKNPGHIILQSDGATYPMVLEISLAATTTLGPNSPINRS